MLGDLTGEFKQPQDNPVEDKARVEKAIDMWLEECVRRGVSEKHLTREAALKFIAPEMVEARDYEASRQAAAGTWNEPIHADAKHGEGKS